MIEVGGCNSFFVFCGFVCLLLLKIFFSLQISTQ